MKGSLDNMVRNTGGGKCRLTVLRCSCGADSLGDMMCVFVILPGAQPNDLRAPPVAGVRAPEEIVVASQASRTSERAPIGEVLAHDQRSPGSRMYLRTT